jgi:hypothetical protein
VLAGSKMLRQKKPVAEDKGYMFVLHSLRHLYKLVGQDLPAEALLSRRLSSVTVPADSYITYVDLLFTIMYDHRP